MAESTSSEIEILPGKITTIDFVIKHGFNYIEPSSLLLAMPLLKFVQFKHTSLLKVFKFIVVVLVSVSFARCFVATALWHNSTEACNCLTCKIILIVNLRSNGRIWLLLPCFFLLVFTFLKCSIFNWPDQLLIAP